MSFESVAYSIGRWFKKNGGTILTCFAAGGVVATGVLSGRAAIKAHEKLKEMPEDSNTKDKVRAIAPMYILPASVGITTVACLLGANTLNRKQQASMLAATAIIEQTYKRYKGKAEELLGKGKVETELAKEDYDEAKPEVKDDERLFYYNYYHDDPTSEYGFYFTANKNDVLKAEYELNRTFNIRETVTLNEFLKLLNQDEVEGGNEVGWSKELGHDYYGYSWIDFEHFDTTMDDGLECTIITTPFDPCMLDND